MLRQRPQIPFLTPEPRKRGGEGGAYHWHCSWLLQHNAAAWTPPCLAPCVFFHLPTCVCKTGGDDPQVSNAEPLLRCFQSYLALAAAYVMKWGLLPSVSSNFSRKVTSQVSPGLRHSSFCKTAASLFDLSDGKNTNFKPVFTHQNRNDAFVLLFNQVTNDFVVKVLHCLPLELEEKKCVFQRSMYFDFKAGQRKDSRRSPPSHTPPAQTSAWARWRAAVTSHCNSWCRIAQSCAQGQNVNKETKVNT